MQPTFSERLKDCYEGCFGCCLPKPSAAHRHSQIGAETIEQISQQVVLEGL